LGGSSIQTGQVGLARREQKGLVDDRLKTLPSKTGWLGAWQQQQQQRQRTEATSGISAQ
jgi:hypothetical protein